MIFESGFKAEGRFRDIIIHEDGSVEERPWSNNLIVKNLGVLVARMLKNDPQAAGLAYWAIGSGSSGWDTSPSSPTINDTQLLAEFYRKAIQASDIKYIDDNDVENANPTNRLQVSLTFGPGEGTGTWREFALFAGNATSTPNSGTNINRKIHGRIDKTATMTIIRQIRFTFVKISE